jgi:hypothetical protein
MHPNPMSLAGNGHSEPLPHPGRDLPPPPIDEPPDDSEPDHPPMRDPPRRPEGDPPMTA